MQRRFAETPFEIPIAIYFGAFGIASLISGNGITPHTVDMALPWGLILAWTIGLAVGGVLCVIGRFAQHHRTEMAGLILLGYGASLYAAALLVVGPAASTANAAAAMVAIATGCGIRLRILHKSQRTREIAHELRCDADDGAT